MPQMNMVEAINLALQQEMEADERVILLGEDIGLNGGVFRVTDGLQKRFGEDRVVDTPLSEGGIMGTAVGLAQAGMRPVPEIQFEGFLGPAYDQLVNQAARCRFTFQRLAQLGQLVGRKLIPDPAKGEMGRVGAAVGFKTNGLGQRLAQLPMQRFQGCFIPLSAGPNDPGAAQIGEAANIGQGQRKRRAGRRYRLDRCLYLFHIRRSYITQEMKRQVDIFRRSPADRI